MLSSNPVLKAPRILRGTKTSSMPKICIATEDGANIVTFGHYEVFITENDCPTSWRRAAVVPFNATACVVIKDLIPGSEYKLTVRGSLLDEIYSPFSPFERIRTSKGGKFASSSLIELILWTYFFNPFIYIVVYLRCVKIHLFRIMYNFYMCNQVILQKAFTVKILSLFNLFR